MHSKLHRAEIALNSMALINPIYLSLRKNTILNLENNAPHPFSS